MGVSHHHKNHPIRKQAEQYCTRIPPLAGTSVSSKQLKSCCQTWSSAEMPYILCSLFTSLVLESCSTTETWTRCQSCRARLSDEWVFFAPSSSCAPFLWFSEYGKRSNEACTWFAPPSIRVINLKSIRPRPCARCPLCLRFGYSSRWIDFSPPSLVNNFA